MSDELEHVEIFWHRIWRSLHELLDLVEGKLGSHQTPASVVLHFPTKGNTMSDLTIQLGGTDTGAITAADATGAAVPVTFDAGSVVATLLDSTTAVATVSADQLSVVIHGANLTVAGTPNVLTVSASVAGVALNPATQAFDVVPASTGGGTGGTATQVVLTFAAPVA